MNEALRLAYLEAMGIPVWVPRSAVVAPSPAATAAAPVAVVASAPVAAPAAAEARPVVDASPPSALAGVREQLRGRAAAAPPAAQAAPPSVRKPQATPPAAANAAQSLRLAQAAGILFIDDAAGDARGDNAAELLGALVFALCGARLALELETLVAPAGPMQLHDVLLGRLARLARSEPVAHIVLTGAGAAALLLGWDSAGFAARDRQAQAVAGSQAPCWVTLGLCQMLDEPVCKRVVWADLAGLRAALAAAT